MAWRTPHAGRARCDGRRVWSAGRATLIITRRTPEAAGAVRALRAGLRPEAAALIPDVDAAVPISALMADVEDRVPEPALVLADGFRTVEAARREKRTTIRATIQEGTLADAIELAITRNAKRARLLSMEQGPAARSAVRGACHPSSHSLLAPGSA
jgi:hypothetical protein